MTREESVVQRLGWLPEREYVLDKARRLAKETLRRRTRK